MVEFSCRELRSSDECALVQLLLRLRATIARISHISVYRAVIRESHADQRIHILVCTSGPEIAGYVIAIADWREFWKGFILRHPIIGARIVAQRARGARSREQARAELCTPGIDTNTLAGWPEVDDRRWEDSAPTIAKVVHVGVDPLHQGRGLASALYRSLMERLANRGVERLDARIDLPNTASARLHIATGWQVKRLPEGYFASIDLIHASHSRDGHDT
jgi:ribosomal protein S18 acetylase RimI-like enzyme